MPTDPTHADRVAAFFQDPHPYLSRSYNIRLRRETVREMIGDRRPEQVLDIGCGDGSLSIQLLAGGSRLTLLDVSEGMLAVTRTRVPPQFIDQVEFRHGDIMAVDLLPAEFDLVLCLGVLAHVADPYALLDRVCSLVRPGGLVVLTVSSGVHPVGFLRSLYSRLRDLVLPPTHRLKYLSGRAVLARCARHGLRLESSFRYNFPPPGADRLLSNERLYRFIRRCHGTVRENTRAWLGSEYIFALTRSPALAG
jgi:2-polyprenyl-3-methyl-5-hydroxy-6-metoxy-1,4-benzoquinol methylase